MDCAAEEQLVRMALEPLPEVRALAFDLPGRRLEVYHEGDGEAPAAALAALGLGQKRVSSESVDVLPLAREEAHQRRTLWWVLAINAAFFAIELTAGLLSRSVGLVADSLDMLADASVYALSLLAVGGTLARKKRVATFSGYVQLALALFGFFEVARRSFGFGESPDPIIMVGVAGLALLANAVCLRLLQREGRREAHMQASYIFTSNDIIVNGGVILAGVLVYLLESRVPDLVVGTVVFAVVLRGAVRIIRLGR